jgi:uncharacterized protein (TIGR02217 family)
MTFTETRLDLGYDFGTVGGPQFSTTIIVLGSGYEQRNSNWSEARSKWQIGDRIYSRSELNYLINFFRGVRGAATGFRFKDWSDYQGINELIGVGNGWQKEFQLRKTYTINDQSSTRNIKKPVSGKTTISVAGTPVIRGVSVDTTTGIITFTSPPTGNITASFEFDVPVRFEQDKFDHRFDAADPSTGEALFYVSTLSVVEIKID